MRSRGPRRLLLSLLLASALLVACTSDAEEPEARPSPSPSPSPEPVFTCPLSGTPPSSEALLERIAVAVKVENNPVAYPLSGLEKAELVFEEQVEGGMTRFMAIYHCSDSGTIGPVRSSREVDPAIMIPITRVLAAAGGNDIVRQKLIDNKIVLLDEDTAGDAMRRVPRSGVTFEHTLYGNSKDLRKLGTKSFKRPPPQDLFAFSEDRPKGRKVETLTLQFGSATTIEYKWKKGRWHRSERGEPFMTDKGSQLAFDNIVIEEHIVNNSNRIFDVAGNPSIEIADAIGEGRVLIFRDGRALYGRWFRKSLKKPVRYETKEGEPIALQPGTTIVELLPNKEGEIKGSFKIQK